MPRKKAETVSFEEGLKRLETIVEQLESGDLPLEQTVALYKEGMELSQNCAAQLKKVQQDVKKIVETSQDDFKAGSFPGGERTMNMELRSYLRNRGALVNGYLRVRLGVGSISPVDEAMMYSIAAGASGCGRSCSWRRQMPGCQWDGFRLRGCRAGNDPHLFPDPR